MAYYIEHDPRGCSESMSEAAIKLHRDTGATVEIARWNIWRVEGVDLLELAEWLDDEGFNSTVCTLVSNPTVHAA